MDSSEWFDLVTPLCGRTGHASRPEVCRRGACRDRPGRQTLADRRLPVWSRETALRCHASVLGSARPTCWSRGAEGQELRSPVPHGSTTAKLSDIRGPRACGRAL